jgi:hypothetical protein
MVVDLKACGLAHVRRRTAVFESGHGKRWNKISSDRRLFESNGFACKPELALGMHEFRMLDIVP